MARVKLHYSGNAASRLKCEVRSLLHATFVFFFAVTKSTSPQDIDLKVHKESLLSFAASLIRKLLTSSLQIKKKRMGKGRVIIITKATCKLIPACVQ